MTNIKAWLFAIVSPALAQGCSTAPSADLQQILTRPPVIERRETEVTVPLDIRMNKLFLPATANGQTREFIFDTGSPTILSRAFADSLGLKIIGQSTGRDANGRAVTMEVAVVDRLSLGGIVFHQVPVMVFDFSQLDLGHCIFDGGVIGSEILPGSVWLIDTENAQLSILDTQAPSGPSSSNMRLQDFGYPHAPVVSYSVGDLHDNALFDTGNAEQLVLYTMVAEGDAIQSAIEPGSVATGHGSDGVSAGGRGSDRDILRFTLSDFHLGSQAIEPVRATTRETAPSLIGAGILDRYIVTLDYKAGRFILQNRQHPAVKAPDPGYAVSIVEGAATVTRLLDGTPPALAGLRLGDWVASINGLRLAGEDAEAVCKATSWLEDVFDRRAAAELIVVRNGQHQTVSVPSQD